jgi:hypothetical protein
VPFTFEARARPLLIILLLVVAAAGAGLLALQRARSSSDASPKPASPTRTQSHSSPSVKAPRAASTRRKAATPAAADQLPFAIRQALAANRVVVVALYDPKAKIDGTAMGEAQAGAQLAGSSFVPVDVRTNAVDSLNARYGVIQDPAVLVLRPPGSLVVRIEGFADRDTVAQAAVNAAS